MAITQDPFEEFEFRPINEGLGFHRTQKTQTTATPQTSANTTSSTAKNSFSTNTTGMFEAPLPRNNFQTEFRTDIGTKKSVTIPTIEDDSIAKAQTAVNEILKNLNQKRQLDFVNETEKQRALLRKSKPFMFAATLDAMLISAAFLLCMIAMLTITKVDLFLNLTHPETSSFIYLSTLALFLTVTFVYMVINRAFVGHTPGEWAFDQRCGTEEEMTTLTYIPRLAFRTLVVMATGFITLPVLSTLFNKDIAGQISGITLFRKPNV